MPKLPTLALLICTIGATISTASADARVNQRQQRQQVRIDRGVANGSLTAQETLRLQKQQTHIATYEARSRADGGGLGPRERARIETMQDRASHTIYRQKHDRQRVR